MCCSLHMYSKLLKLQILFLLQSRWPCHLIGHYWYGTRLLAEKHSAVLNGTAYLLNFLLVITACSQLMNQSNLLLACPTVNKLLIVQLEELPKVFFMQSTSLCWTHERVVVLFIMWALQRKFRKRVSVHVHKALVAQWQKLQRWHEDISTAVLCM